MIGYVKRYAPLFYIMVAYAGLLGLEYLPQSSLASLNVLAGVLLGLVALLALYMQGERAFRPTLIGLLPLVTWVVVLLVPFTEFESHRKAMMLFVSGVLIPLSFIPNKKNRRARFYLWGVSGGALIFSWVVGYVPPSPPGIVEVTRRLDILCCVIGVALLGAVMPSPALRLPKALISCLTAILFIPLAIHCLYLCNTSFLNGPFNRLFTFASDFFYRGYRTGAQMSSMFFMIGVMGFFIRSLFTCPAS